MKYFHKAEIFFWKVSVELMKNRRIFAVSLTVSLLMMLILTLITVRAVMSANHPESIDMESSFELSTGDNAILNLSSEVSNDFEQHNLLLILVDSLIANKPDLRGVWLAGQVYPIPQIVFLPLYPTVSEIEQSDFNSSFSLDENGHPSEEFQKFLRSKEVWWNHYVVLDETSLADLVALTDGIYWNGKQVNGSGAVEEILINSSPPEIELNAQASIVNELCRSAQELLSSSDPMILWGLLTHRMRSDLQLEMVQAAQNEYAQPGGEPVCEFPTMSEVAIGNETGE